MPDKNIIIGQLNMNRSRQAHDLLEQTCIEEKIAVLMLTEPNLNRILNTKNQYICSRDSTNSAAILINHRCIKARSEKLYAGQGFVVVGLAGIVFISIYLAPRLKIREVEEILQDVERCIKYYKSKSIIMAGDFNARSKTWGDVLTNARGVQIEEWSLLVGLYIVNRGSVPTCVRSQGVSIVDLTLTNGRATRRIRNWRVAEKICTLSDHRLIAFELSAEKVKTTNQYSRAAQKIMPKWSYKNLDVGMLKASILVETWAHTISEQINAEEAVKKLNEAMRRSCDATMKRTSGRSENQAVYWWSAELANMRRRCIAANRKLSRLRRRKDPPLVFAEALCEKRNAKKDFKKEISKQKRLSWDRLLLSLEDDPWGLPYKVVTNKLMKPGSEITATMAPAKVEEIVTYLFPEGNQIEEPTRINDEDYLPFVMNELELTMREISSKKIPAPGPDGVNSRILVIAVQTAPQMFLDVLNKCLEEKKFPIIWKKARLVLLKKPNKHGDDASTFRPISLLNEISKLFERMIKRRINKYMTATGMELSCNQYGFRRGLSCLSAFERAKNAIFEGKIKKFNTCIVSLDISNAFNSLSGNFIIKNLRKRKMPQYIVELITNYLQNRELIWISAAAKCVRKGVSRGVPQGSVLGPLLWNLCYDEVLEICLPEGCGIVGYADDTLLVSTQEHINTTISSVQIMFEQIKNKLLEMELTLSSEKTEVVWSACKGESMDGVVLQLDENTKTIIKKNMRYLGIQLDNGLTYAAHIRLKAEKTKKLINGLQGIMQNLKGPKEKKRRLYINTVQSSVLYGCPHWIEGVWKNNKILAPYHKINRLLAQRVISSYNTVSRVASELLARMLPIDFLAQAYAEAYAETNGHANNFTIGYKKEILKNKKITVRKIWKSYLRNPKLPGKRVREAILPVFDSWMDRETGELEYYTTQIITGHGSFREYLYRINKVDSERCLHCTGSSDTAQHTLEVCPEWHRERQSLQEEIGNDLSLKKVIKQMLASPMAWEAFRLFCKTVLIKKEEKVRNLIIAGVITK